MTYPIRRIVAGVSVLHGPDPILTAAVALAERIGAKLHIVYAHQIQPLALGPYASVGMIDATALQEYYEERRSRLAKLVSSLTSSDRVDFEVSIGPAAAMILAAAEREQADLIMVGATRHGRVARVLLGTTAQRVIRKSHVPVLILRNLLGGHVGRILVTTDMTEFSAGIHEIGLDLVETLFRGAAPELRSLHVLPDGFPIALDSEFLHQAVTEATAKFLRQRRPRNPPVAPVGRLGDPAREIPEEANSWKADLLILGTHARRGKDRWLLGSVSEAAARDAECNVLMIPGCMEEEPLLAPLPAYIGDRGLGGPMAAGHTRPGGS